MTLRIRVDVNGDEIADIRIRNLGHPHTGDTEPHDDLRLYSVCTLTHTDQGDEWTAPVYVLHRRNEGWKTLTEKALAEL